MHEVVIVYTERARKDLLRLEKGIARKIVLKVRENANMLEPLMRAKALAGSFAGLYRYRVQNYRVIFEIDKSGTVSVVTVLTIGHRKDVYG